MKSKNVIWKGGVLMALSFGLLLGMGSCSDDDPNYDDVTPPVVETAPNTVSGVVASISGSAISGATVTLQGSSELTATTDAQGLYTVENVPAGEYVMRAEAEGFLPSEGTLTVSNDANQTQKFVWNASLPTDISVGVTASATEDTEGDLNTETLEGNDLATVNIQLNIPAAAVSGDNPEVKLTPLYATSAPSTRAASNLMLVGAALSCESENVTLNSSMELSFELNASWASELQARQLRNGEWVAVESRIEGGRVIFDADAFTSYGLFMDVDLTSSTTTQTIEFSQTNWDNLYGSSDLTVDEANYSYEVGTQISLSANDLLSALLIEKLSQLYGSVSTTVSGQLPVGVTLPIGTQLDVTGRQEVTTVSITAFGVTMTAVRYGTVSLQAQATNRSHTGGSN